MTESIHRDLQGDRVASLKTRLDKASAVGLGNENRGPCFRFVDQRGSPKLANVGQLQEGVQTISGTRRCEGFKDCVEDLGGSFVDGSALLGRARIALGMLDKHRRWGASSFFGLFPDLMSA